MITVMLYPLTLRKGDRVMKVRDKISIGTLASSLALAGLALGASNCASNKAAPPAAQSEKGTAHTCGEGQCGEGQCGENKAQEQKKEVEKGAEQTCGEGSCGN
jgi:uncharacterized low-complexity protein